MKPRDLVLPDVEGALRYLVGRAEYKPGEWQYVRTGPGGALHLAWRLKDGHELAISRGDRMPEVGDLYEVRKAMLKANLEEKSVQELPERKTVVLRLLVVQQQLAL